jgi:D-alanyl-lipoteichoic acid acyltransferase DltB (MBOAT superfamily)
MLVNSIVFWIFFAAFLLPYFTVFRGSVKIQNLWLLLASYFFYGCADWRMVFLLFIATLVFFLLPRMSNRKWMMWLGVILGVGTLLYFKYMNFFIDQFASLMNHLGLQVNMPTFQIIMPVGISFFTFKLMSYVIEIQRGNLEPETDFLRFASYIAFFPTIMSGPIDKPQGFLSQLTKSRQYHTDDFAEGCKRVLWGLFMKLCIADQISSYTEAVLNSAYHHNVVSICFAAVLYSFQMYADFGGYSEMAIGTARMMGIRVTENFCRPFFAQNIADFWRRWHISLTSWITEYIFMPLNIAFRNLGKRGLYLATMINLLVIGCWHGANWTFFLFGAFHGVMLVAVAMFDKRRKRLEKQYGLKKNPAYKYSRMLLTFVLVTISFQLFRADSVLYFWHLLQRISTAGFGMVFMSWALTGVLPIAILLFKEYKDENKLNIHFLHADKLWVQVVSFALLLVFIFYTGALNGGQFIYFQF